MEKTKIIEKQILGSLQGKLGANDLSRLVEWMESDPRHLLLFNQVKEQFETQEIERIKASTDLDQLFASFLFERNGKTRKRKAKKLMLYRMAASVALLIGLGFVAFNVFTERSKGDQELTANIEKPYIISGNGEKYVIENKESTIRFDAISAEEVKKEKAVRKPKESIDLNELVVPRGCRITLELSDGTLVYLNSESRLTYPTVFTEDSRHVQLIGEGFFEVSHLEDRPFVVETAHLSVQVLGTSFNISAFADDNRIITTLVQGSVSISSAASDEPIILHPEENGIFMKDSQTLEVELADSRRFTSWINGYYTFHSESLDLVIQKLIRSYGIAIILDNESLKSLRFSGKLDIKETLTDVLDIIKLVAPISYETSKNQIIIQKTTE